MRGRRAVLSHGVAVAVVAAMTTAGVGAAQVHVGKNVQVSAGRGTVGHQEVILGADATNAKELIACSMIDASPHRGVGSVAYASFDGGLTWTFGVRTTEHFSGDPDCTFGPDGTAYLITTGGITDPPPYASDADHIVLRRSPEAAVGTVTVSARLRNRSREPVAGPIKVRVTALASQLGVVTVGNADNGLRGQGAVWDFSGQLADGRLAAGAYSQPKSRVFKVSDVRPSRQGRAYRFGLVSLEAKILGSRVR